MDNEYDVIVELSQSDVIKNLNELRAELKMILTSSQRNR